MSARRHNQAELVCVWNDLVSAWSEDGADEESGPETGVFSRRPPRDSYTHERPLLSTSWDLHGEDLIEVSEWDGDESTRIHLLPTVRP